MRAPITLMRSSCKMDADFSSPIASNATPCHLSPNIREMNGHISLAACPAAPICPPVSKPPLSPTCAPHRLRATNCHPERSRRISWHLAPFIGHWQIGVRVSRRLCCVRMANYHNARILLVEHRELNIQKIAAAAFRRRVCS